jgi:hypothetical protein
MTFALDLSKAVEAAKANADAVIKKATFELFRSVIEKSPVDTGRFRANWNVAIGSPDLSTNENTDDSPRGEPSVQKMQKTVLGSKFLDQSIFLTNNLPYANVLEEGRIDGVSGSVQAPQGMVRISIVEFNANWGRLTGGVV